MWICYFCWFVFHLFGKSTTESILSLLEVFVLKRKSLYVLKVVCWLKAWLFCSCKHHFPIYLARRVSEIHDLRCMNVLPSGFSISDITWRTLCKRTGQIFHELSITPYACLLKSRKKEVTLRLHYILKGKIFKLLYL